ncbi:BUD32 family EKC/KEOPS complex subunit [Shimia marina]|uniref:tRNA A-37 threonylcarbamoyl transferase component Bud32 n=1 Tax=Shimia marina TaxID=321267 RepID=A0A0P1FCD7_9RHOB|nr:hypothetical protein [Shimia marina]CUH51587.1 hypothetical protein SHM7688_01024 [Shimia marina]SFD45308.1 hypothetical protein SAMN04488037_10182 [Shimia marina]
MAEMDYRAPLSVDDELKMLVETRAREAGPRVEKMQAEGKTFWIKRPEILGLRYRLQKGDPQKAFARERLAYQEMNAAGAPVPQVVADGDDFLVLPDCGPDLRAQLNQDRAAGELRDLLMNASGALGAFHRLGFAHGRPSPKDMCLVEGHVLLLDFERYMPRNNTPNGQARDLVVFAFNVAAHSPKVRDSLNEAMRVYRDGAPVGIWPLAQRWCRRMKWADWLTKPIQNRKDGRSKEFSAIPVVMDLFLTPR